MLKLISLDGKCPSVSVDPIPRSWSGEEKEKEKKEEERKGCGHVSTSIVVASGGASQGETPWAELPSFADLLSDDDMEAPMGATRATPMGAVPGSAKSSCFSFGLPSPCDRASPSPSAVPLAQLTPKSASPALCASLDDVLQTPPLSAKYHGITTSARPPKKKKGEVKTGSSVKAKKGSFVKASKGSGEDTFNNMYHLGMIHLGVFWCSIYYMLV